MKKLSESVIKKNSHKSMTINFKSQEQKLNLEIYLRDIAYQTPTNFFLMLLAKYEKENNIKII